MIAIAAWVLLAAASVDGAHHLHLERDQLVVDSRWSTPTGEVLHTAVPAEATVTFPSPHEIRLTVPMDRVHELDALPLPLPAEDGVHRVTFGRALAYKPGDGLALRPRGLRAVGHDVHGTDIERIEATFGPAPEGQALARYVAADTLRGGLPGHVQTTQSRRRRMLLLASSVFVFVVAALAAVAQTLRRRADEEQADALLAQEIDNL